MERRKEQKKKEKGRNRKTRQSRSEKKVASFSSASLFPARKREAVTQGGTMVTDHLTRRRNQGAGRAKGWEDKNDTRAGPLTLQQLNPHSPHPIVWLYLIIIEFLQVLRENNK